MFIQRDFSSTVDNESKIRCW